MRPVARPIPAEAGAAVADLGLFSVRSGPSVETLKSKICSGKSCPFKAGCPRFVPHFTRVVPTKSGDPRPVQDLPTTLRGTPHDGGTMVTCQWTDLRAWSPEANLVAAVATPTNLCYFGADVDP